ncbi:asparagine synthase-related protein [Azospirillum sp. CT11-132]|uniref:asparagine synthase-related protein n=1 Tax=Azospirillum sp. CT11-132 TaxID=3396317 RepID=UPI0039A59F77
MSLVGCWRPKADATDETDIGRMLSVEAYSQARWSLWQSMWQATGGGTGPGLRVGRCDGAGVATGGPGLTVFIDGTIHNGRDIARALELDGVPDAARLLLTGYTRWGNGILDRVAGEFTCALWDDPARRLVLIRDPVGCKPLHYWQGDGRLLFAGEPRTLMSDAAVPHELDEERLACHLALLPYDGTASFYRGISRVRPGHMLVVEADGGVREERWWRPECVPVLRLPRAADYEEALRAGLDEAVRCRLPASGPVAGELSGGLDSTSIMASAALQLAEQGRRITALTAAPSLVAPLDPTFDVKDEAESAAAVAALYPNMDHVILRADGPRPVLALADAHIAAAGFPPHLVGHAFWWDGLKAEARRRGAGVILTGELGNVILSDQGRFTLAAHLRAGRLGALAHELRAGRRLGRRWRGLAWESIGPLLPPGLHHRILQAVGRDSTVLDYSGISPEFLRETGLAEQVDGLTSNWWTLDGADSRTWRLRTMMLVDRGLYRNAVRRVDGIRMEAPATDRRLVELAFSIPDAQYRKDGMPRSLIRRAMAGRLPASILNEQRRAHQGADWHLHMTAERALFAEEMARLERSPLARRCLDLPRMRQALNEWPDSPLDVPPEKLPLFRYVLGRGVAAGRFLRSFERTNE